MKGMYDGAASVKSHPSSPRAAASARAASRTVGGRPARSASSVRCRLQAFWSASALREKRCFRAVSSSSLRR